MDDLTARVDDWKSLKLEVFGDLLRFGTFTVLKGDGGGKDTEREVRIILSTFYKQSIPLRKRGRLFKFQPEFIFLSVTESTTQLLAPDPWFADYIRRIGHSSLSYSRYSRHNPVLGWKSSKRRLFREAFKRSITGPTHDINNSLPLHYERVAFVSCFPPQKTTAPFTPFKQNHKPFPFKVSH